MQKLKNKRVLAIGELLSVFLSAAILIYLLSPFANGNVIYKQAIIWFAYVTMLSMIWIFVRKEKGEGVWASLGLGFKFVSWKRLLKTFLHSIWVFAFAIAAFVISGNIFSNYAKAQQTIDTSNYQFLEGNLLLLLPMLLAVYVASSFGEEVIYRSFLIKRLVVIGGNKWWVRWVAILLSACIFGLVHFEWGLVGMIQTAFMGLALALSFIWLSGRLWPNVLAHVYLDTILIIQMYLG